MKGSFSYLFLALILTLSLIGYIGLSHEAFYTRDGTEYEQLAENLSTQNRHYAKSAGEQQDLRMYSKRPLGYASFIVLSSCNERVLLKIVQLFLCLLLFILGMQLAKVLDLSLRSMYLYGLLFLFNVPLLLSTQFVMADLFLAVLIGLALLRYFQFRQNLKRSYLNQSMWMIFLAVWVKPVVLPLALALAIIFLILIWFKRAYPSLLLPLLAVLLVCLVNWNTTSVFHYSSISSINRSYYNAKLLIAQEYGLDSAEEYTSGELFQVPSTSIELRERMRALNSRSNETIKTHFLSYVKLHLMGTLKAVIDPGRFELYTFFGDHTDNQRLTELLFAGEFQQVWQRIRNKGWLALIFSCLLLIAVMKCLGTVIAVTKNDPRIWVLALVVLYFAFIAGPVGAFRFVVPASSAFLILSAMGLDRLIQLFQKGSKS